MLDLPVLRSRLVVRERLRAALRLAPEVRLVLVSAPAGFGKTTLLSDWLQREQLDHAWLSMSPADDDPVRFARRLLDALSGPRRPGDTAADAAAPGAGTEDALLALLDCLETRVRPIALVLDDYHVAGAPVRALVARLLERLPAGAVLVLATREDPPLPLAKLRAGGQLVEVRGEALRFTADEADRFLRETMALDLSASQSAALGERTEGWAAGLQLAGLALAERPDPDAFIRDFSGTHRFVLDYLMDEVLTLQPDDVQRFLLETSVLERLSGDLCDAVTGRPGGQAMLERLERSNLFVARLDDERRWYRYHQLFSDLLRARLRRDRAGDERELHERAARWFREHGCNDEAIGHALAAGDVALAVDVIGAEWVPRGHRGEIATVRGWLDRLPAAIVEEDAILSAAYAWMLVLAGEYEGVEGRLHDAESAFARREEARSPAWWRSVPAQVALMRAALAQSTGDAAAAASQAGRALASIPADLERPLAAVLEGEARVTLGQALASVGELEQAVAANRAALPLLWEGGNPFGAAMAAMRLAGLEERLGRHSEALQTCRVVLAEAAARGLEAAPAVASVHVALARLLLAGRDASGAESEARVARDLARRGGQRATAEAAEELLRRSRAGAPGTTGATTSLVEPLTAREVDVLRLLVEGRSNREIADALVVSVGTVKFHVHSVLGKLGATSRLDAVARARSLGLPR